MCMCADPSPAYPSHSISASEPAAFLNLLIFQPTPRQTKVSDSSFSICAIHIHLELLGECLKLLGSSHIIFLCIQQVITSSIIHFSRYINSKKVDYMKALAVIKCNLQDCTNGISVECWSLREDKRYI